MERKPVRHESPDGHFSLILDDDGRTGYAYLVNDSGDITADCWLYNRGVAPTQGEWNSPEKMPFANPAEYIDPKFRSGFILPNGEGDVSVGWLKEGAELFVEGRLFARLVSGSKPGWSRLAVKDGPLALPFTD